MYLSDGISGILTAGEFNITVEPKPVLWVQAPSVEIV